MANQRPSFYEISLFPKLENLSQKWELIQKEFKELDAPVMNINRVNKTHQEVLNELSDYIQDGNVFGWVQGWGKSGINPEWKQYWLVFNDNIIPYVKPNMPNTIEILAAIKGIKVCALVTLNAGSSLPCHSHPEIYEEGLLQLHIPLITAITRNYTYLNVNGEFYQYSYEKPVVFDGSLDHFAINESEMDRTILYMEFDKRLLLND